MAKKRNARIENSTLSADPTPVGVYTDRRAKMNIPKKQNLYFFIISIYSLNNSW